MLYYNRMSVSEIFENGVAHPWANLRIRNLLCDENIQMQQYKLSDFSDITLAVGINQAIVGGVKTQLNNFTLEFGNLQGMNLTTGVFAPNLLTESGIYMWQVQLVITGLLAPSSIIVYFYDGLNLIGASTQYLINDLTGTAYCNVMAETALFNLGQQTLRCQVLCPDNINISGIWGMQRLYLV